MRVLDGITMCVALGSAMGFGAGVILVTSALVVTGFQYNTDLIETGHAHYDSTTGEFTMNIDGCKPEEVE